jgi:thiol:disulfide interchange protein DsbC
MPGLYEVRVGTDLFYTDAKGNYLIQGELIDTRATRNLTEDRINKLTAVDFGTALKDAFTIVRQGQAQAGRVRRPQLRLLQAL